MSKEPTFGSNLFNEITGAQNLYYQQFIFNNINRWFNINKAEKQVKNFTSSDDEFCEEKSWSRWMNFQKLLSHLTQPSLGQMEQVLFTTSYTRIICFSHFLCLHLFLNLISWHLQLYHPVVYFFYLTSVIFYITVIANHRLVI